MPRDVAGNYTLPAGNPVVSGTPISSSVHNSTNNDIASAMTDSLSRSGLGGMLAALPFADGLIGAPSITFTSELTSGFWKPANLQVAVSITGQNAMIWEPTQVIASVPLFQFLGAPFNAQFAVVNVRSDTTILGQWQFTYDGTTFKGPQVATYGGMLFNAGATETSGRVNIVTVAPGVGDGKPGDIWLVV
jgi:hypothetical protein